VNHKGKLNEHDPIPQTPYRSRSSHQKDKRALPPREEHPSWAYLHAPHLVGTPSSCRLPRRDMCGALVDPADPLCPEKFKKDAAALMKRFFDPMGTDGRDFNDPMVLRGALLDFIADFVENKQIAYVGKFQGKLYDPFNYGNSLDPNEIDFSDDMFIIRGEEAIKYIEPSILTSIDISPQYVKIKPSDQKKFTIKGFDQHKREIPVQDVKWTATGGIIDAMGNYLAGENEGEFEVTVYVGKVKSSIKVAVSKQEKPEIHEPEKSGRISWNGEIPPQKWMNFYTKILSKFAGGKGLKLKLTVEVAEEGGISTQKLEETKAALRELGLDDNVSNE